MIRKIEVERFTLSSSKPFDQVVAALNSAVGHPDISEFWKSTHRAQSVAELQSTIEKVLGQTGLMLFAEFAHGAIVRKGAGRDTLETKNKARVLEAFDTLFNRRDYAAAEKFWSPDYIQHSAHIRPGREGLFNLVKTLPPTLKYEPGTIVADGDFVIVHGRFSGFNR